MSRVLWGNGGGGSRHVLDYTAAEDRRRDARLLWWDVLGTLGHLAALRPTGVLSEDEYDLLVAALRDAAAAVRAGTLTVGEDDEDSHTALERWLVARAGETGERVHTGRSRNDQVITALRLYMKDSLLRVLVGLLDVADVLTSFAAVHRWVLWPGYTHLRPAMPSTVGLWAGSFAESLADDIVSIESALTLVDRSPLGSAAGYGVPLDLDRVAAARVLGFASVQTNVVAVQSSRGKLEAQVVASLWPIGFDLGKLAWDVVLFTAPEYGYLRLPPEMSTGSSIMPHKRNPDLFEITRGRAAVLEGLLAQAVATAGRLPSGYHRDLQESKAPLMAALDMVDDMLTAMARAVPRLEVDEARCVVGVSGGVLATDEVYRRVRLGVPFRQAYREVAAEQAHDGSTFVADVDALLARRRTPGGAGNPDLEGLQARLEAARRGVEERRRTFDSAVRALLDEGGCDG